MTGTDRPGAATRNRGPRRTCDDFDGDVAEAFAWDREIARHIGHADLLRERIHGASGY